MGTFPKQYQSINNDPFDSKLVVAGQSFPLVNPKTLLKTETFERIQIDLAKDILELELEGKPLSRQGTLKINGKVVADVTCH